MKRNELGCCDSLTKKCGYCPKTLCTYPHSRGHYHKAHLGTQTFYSVLSMWSYTIPSFMWIGEVQVYNITDEKAEEEEEENFDKHYITASAGHNESPLN